MNTLEQDQQAFAVLIMEEDSQMIMHSVCKKFHRTYEERKDAIQDVIMQAWRSFPDFKGESKFTTWLYRIAEWTCISNLRKAKSQASAILTHNILYDAVDYNAAVKNHQYRDKILDEAMKQLSEFERDLIEFYIAKVPRELICSFLKLTPAAYNIRFKRAKDKLMWKAYQLIKLTDEEFWSRAPPESSVI